jgi:hypothetical protein
MEGNFLVNLCELDKDILGEVTLDLLKILFVVKVKLFLSLGVLAFGLDMVA